MNLVADPPAFRAQGLAQEKLRLDLNEVVLLIDVDCQDLQFWDAKDLPPDEQRLFFHFPRLSDSLQWKEEEFYSRLPANPQFLRRADLWTLREGIKRYQLENGNPPPGLAALKWYGLGEDILRDPWGKTYVYRHPGVQHPEGYDLLSVGRDGQEGTADDIDAHSLKDLPP